MNRSDVQDFHRTANVSRDAVYGVAAMWKNKAILLACHVLSDLDLAAGGFERVGTMRALYSGLDGPQEHDHVYITDPQFVSFGAVWVVKQMVPSIPHASTSYVLEPIP